MGLRHQKEEEKTVRWLEVDATMTGTLAFKDPVNLRINGRFEGTLETKGLLSIGEAARVHATIRGESLTIAGEVQGEITASQRVELLSTARLTGKISSPRVIMQEGAFMQGTLDMGSLQAGTTWMTPEELARYLEVDVTMVLEWAKSGRLPAQREGDEWHFERTKIEQWLAQEKIK